MKLFSELKVHRLRFLLPIGVSAEERAHPQPVSVSLEIRFETPPAACQSGKLDETVGYDRLAVLVERAVHARSYQLIETLGYDVYQVLRETLPEKTRLKLSVLKEKPPIDSLQGGAEFVLSEWGP